MFNAEIFVEGIMKSKNVCSELKRDLLTAYRKACGVEILKPELGMVYQSRHGLRLLVKVPSYYNLISIWSYDSQYDNKIGEKLNVVMRNIEAVEEYINTRNYREVCRIEKLISEPARVMHVDEYN